MTGLHTHHRATFDNLVAVLERDDSILALLLTGSGAHGFETAESDVDAAAVVSTKSYRDHGGLTCLSFDAATYEGDWSTAGTSTCRSMSAHYRLDADRLRR